MCNLNKLQNLKIFYITRGGKMLKVKKRDGRIVPFDGHKIINAVLAAFKQVDKETEKKMGKYTSMMPGLF